MNPAITAVSTISCHGMGFAAFESAVRARQQDRHLPAVLAGGQAPGFVIEDVLGKKGTGSMDRCSALAIAAARALPSPEDTTTEPGRGVVLGTTAGSTQTQHDFTTESLTRRKPYFVNPATMPFALMNSAAAQVAIWQGLKGPNSTIAAGRVSGIAVLRYATRLLAAGRARELVCGAVEEHSATREWLERNRGKDAAFPLGEGAALLLLESQPTERRPLAEVVAARSVPVVDGETLTALDGCVRAVLAAQGIGRDEIGLAVPSGARDVEMLARLAGEQAVLAAPAEITGDVGAATGPLQLAAMLAVGRPSPEAPFALGTAADDGIAGCVLLRLAG